MGAQNDKSAVRAAPNASWLKRLFAFIGPAYLVSVGYMDPGNWATDIAGGSAFGYALLWVLVMSNLMAILLQGLAARLGIVTGLDLAQACRREYGRAIRVVLWLLAEVAIIATDLAEVLGSALGLNLIFHIPLMLGVILTAFDALLILLLQNAGIRRLEAVVVGFVAVIGLSFLAEIIMARPDPVAVAGGLVPSLPGGTALFIAIGIIGATVMPHNLYLHSSLVQTRTFERSLPGIKRAIKYNRVDSAVALNIAFFVNAAILVLAATVFHKSGHTDVADIAQAHRLLAPLLGTFLAPLLFGIALIAAGQASTITGTLSGQIVMEGFINLRLTPWVRRLVTRLLAVVPAALAILYFGDKVAGSLLVLSQVILSLQLSFAVIPLIHFTSDRNLMGAFAIKGVERALAWIVALAIAALNIKLVIETVGAALRSAPWPLAALAVAAAAASALLLAYVIFAPLLKKAGVPLSSRASFMPVSTDVPEHSRSASSPFTAHEEAGKVFGEEHGSLVLQKVKPYGRILLAVDFGPEDAAVLSFGLTMAGPGARLVLAHVVESVSAKVFGDSQAGLSDAETRHDRVAIDSYARLLQDRGAEVETALGFGKPGKELKRLAESRSADLIVIGSHRHNRLGRLLFGSTADSLRRHTKAPIVVAR